MFGSRQHRLVLFSGSVRPKRSNRCAHYGYCGSISHTSHNSAERGHSCSNRYGGSAPPIAEAGRNKPSPASPIPTADWVTVVIPGTTIELPHLTDDEEIEIGRKTAREVETEEYHVFENEAQRQRITHLGQQIIPHTERPHLPYQFKLLDTPEINAFAVPGGFIYVTRGMLEFVRTDEEMVAVLAHEIAHVAQRHGGETLEALAVTQVAGELLLESQPDLADIYQTEGGQLATQFSAFLLHNGWSQQQEYEADEYGAIYMARAGYNPRDMVALLRRMQSEFESEEPGIAEQLIQTHPPFADRIKWVEEVIQINGL